MKLSKLATAGFSFFVIGLFAIPLLFTIPGSPVVVDMDYALLAVERFANTLFLSALVGVVSVMIGGFAGSVLSLVSIPFQRTISVVLTIPAIFPSYALAILYSDVSSSVFSNTGYVFLMSSVCFSYCFILAYNATNNVSSKMISSIETLGLSRSDVFWKCIVPLLKPSLFVGFIVSFAESFSEFGTAIYLGSDTITVLIYRLWFGAYQYSDAKIISLVTFTLTLSFLALVWWKSNLKPYQFKNDSITRERKKKFHLSKGMTLTLLMSLIAIATITVIIPCFVLVKWSLIAFPKTNLIEMLNVFCDTFKVALLGSVSMVAFAFALVELKKNKLSNLAIALVENGYFLPSIVIGVGFLSLSQRVEWLQDFGYAIFIVAICVKLSVIPFNMIKSDSVNLSEKLESTVSMFGKSKTWYLIHVKYPILSKGLILSLLLVFIKVAKELPLTMMLRPFGVDTISTQAFHYASAETPYMSAPWLVLIVLLSGVATLLAYKLSKK